MNTELFTDQIVSTEKQMIRTENIFQTEDGVPSWLIYFTAEDNPNYKCPRCEKLLPQVHQLAQELQINQPEANFKVAKVNCVDPESGKICDYFQMKNIPGIMVIRPDLN